MASELQALYDQFAEPSAEWRGKPFWSWNGELEEKELLRQVDVLKEMGFGGHFMHSRSGLITEYLGEEWFRLINAVADKSEKEGMEAWLYDEDRWPSGSAGGKATVEDKYRMRSLRLSEFSPHRFQPSPSFFSLYIAAVDENGKDLLFYEKTTEDAVLQQIEKNLALYGSKLRVLAFDITVDPDNSNYNGSGYLNTLDEDSVRHFIDLTHEEYKKHCVGRLGTSVKGIFTDEPHRGHGFDDLREEDGIRTCQTAWTFDFFEEFRKRYGYDLTEKLPELFYRYKGQIFSKIKVDWFDLACNLFNERFAKPINEWCKENGMAFTGHVLHEDELINQTVTNGSLMRFYENMDVPGVDTLGCDNYRYQIVKQLASTARQTGKKRLLSELYGCTGWDFDFTGHKNIGNWQAFFGINLRCPHLSWYTMEGAAKRDYPASILHQAPWYKDYYAIETYFARFGLLCSADAICDTLVLNPIESVWGLSYLGWSDWLFSRDEAVNKVEEHYEQLLSYLLSSHIDFDYGEEEMMSRLASVSTENGQAVLRVGLASYKTVIVSGMLTIRSSTLALLQTFKEKGGKIIFAGEPPLYVDGEKNKEAERFSLLCCRVPFRREDIAGAIGVNDTPRITVDAKNADRIFIRRFTENKDVICVALLNSDIEQNSGRINVDTGIFNAAFAEEWNLMTGEKFSVPCVKSNRGSLCFETELGAGDAKIFMLSDEKPVSEKCPTEKKCDRITDISDTSCRYTLKEKNVCVIDHSTWREINGETHPWTEILRTDNAIRDHFGIERRSGEMLQPWFSKLHRSEILGKIEIEYIFHISALPDGDVYLAAERPESMHYSINGVPLEPERTFWIDNCFKKMKIPSAALTKGENIVTIKTDFCRNTNPEAIYLIGDFGVQVCGPTVRLFSRPEKLRFGNACEQGLPFYGGNIVYHIAPSVLAPFAAKSRILLSAEGVQGAFLKYSSEVESGSIFFRPYEADITASVKAGCGIDLELVGSRRNTFGTLHMLPADHKGSSPGQYTTTGEDWTDDIAVPPVGIQKLFIKTAD